MVVQCGDGDITEQFRCVRTSADMVNTRAANPAGFLRPLRRADPALKRGHCTVPHPQKRYRPSADLRQIIVLADHLEQARDGPHLFSVPLLAVPLFFSTDGREQRVGLGSIDKLLLNRARVKALTHSAGVGRAEDQSPARGEPGRRLLRWRECTIPPGWRSSAFKACPRTSPRRAHGMRHAAAE
jgi:hypothetical protein